MMHQLSRSLIFVLLGSVALLLCVGLTMIYSITYSRFDTFYFYRQVLWIGMGLAGMFLVTFTPRQWMSKYSHWLLIIIAAALGYLFLAHLATKLAGDEAMRFFPLVPGRIKGSFRWLRLGQLTVQPSEFAKFGLLLYLASYFGSRSRAQIESGLTGFLIPGLASGVVLGLIFLGKDLSTTVLTSFMVISLMYLAGVRTRYLTLAVLLGVAALGAAILSNPERLSRVSSYRHPERDPLDNGYQLWRSQLALGSGGRFGRGFTRSIMKHVYLPESYTDFIMSVIGEELGYLGVVSVLFLYAVFFACTVGMAFFCRQQVDMLICMGAGLLVIMQALINISVVTGWCPTTGLTAPFLSYGGSSTIASLLCVGLVFNVGLRNLFFQHQESLNAKVIPTGRVFHLGSQT